MSTTRPPSRSPTGFDWIAWVQWLFLTTLGWLLGIFFTTQIDALLGDRIGLIAELGIGLAIGLMQWIKLRSLNPHSAWWIVATGLGWALALELVRLVGLDDIELRGALIGSILGVGQWFVLRRSFGQAGWWIVVSALAWTVGQTLGIFLVGALVGAVTGVAFVLLPRRRRPRPEPDTELPA
jgi:hypothetical protein